MCQFIYFLNFYDYFTRNMVLPIFYLSTKNSNKKNFEQKFMEERTLSKINNTYFISVFTIDN